MILTTANKKVNIVIYITQIINVLILTGIDAIRMSSRGASFGSKFGAFLVSFPRGTHRELRTDTDFGDLT